MARIPLSDILLQTSIKVGNVYLPPNSLLPNLQAFCVPLLEYTDDDYFQVCARGSSFRVRLNDRFFQIFTRHQLNGIVSCSHVAFMNSDGSHFTVGGKHYSHNAQDRHTGDIAVWDVTDRVLAQSIDKNMFFNLSAGDIVSPSTDVTASIAYGYPFEKQIFESAAKPDGNWYLEHIGARLQEIVFDGEPNSNDEDLCVFHRSEALDMDPNGLSGSPVFSICKNSDGFFLALAGMVITSNGKVFQAIKANHILSFLKEICRSKNSV